MNINRETVKLSDGTEVVVVTPSPKQEVEARKFYLRKWKEWKEVAMTNKEMNDFIVSRGFVNAEREEKVKKLSQEVIDIRRKLKAGKKGYATLDEARKAALSIRTKIDEINSIRGELNEFALKTAESQAEVDRFNYLVSMCVFKDSEPYFEDYEDYLARQDEPDTLKIAAKYAALTTPYVEEDGLESEEDKFLYKYGFIDEKKRLVDKQGRLIDEEGRLINEDGRFIDEAGNFVDINKNPVDADGNPIVDFEDFTDESGEVIQPRNLPA